MPQLRLNSSWWSSQGCSTVCCSVRGAEDFEDFMVTNATAMLPPPLGVQYEVGRRPPALYPTQPSHRLLIHSDRMERWGRFEDLPN